MKYLLILLLFTSCQKELTNPCGKVTGKGAALNIHSTYLEVDGIRKSVDLPTYSKYKIGDYYCD